MASTPHFYSNQLSDYFTDLITTTNNPSIIGITSPSVIEDNTMWGDQQRYGGLVPLLDTTFGASLLHHHRDHTLSSTSPSMHYYSDTWSPSSFPLEHRASLPEVSDLRTNNNHSFYGINNNNEGFQSFLSVGLSSYQQQPYNNNNNIGDFVDECCALVEDVKPLTCPSKASRDNWGIQGNQVVAVDQENIKVGRYSEEERKERILRYLRKRNQRNFNKTIKYACRKTLADRRVRVRGRFARNNELCEDNDTMKKNMENLQQYDLYGDDSIQYQLRNEEEDWLQEAMESLVFLSHSSPEDI